MDPPSLEPSKRSRKWLYVGLRWLGGFALLGLLGFTSAIASLYLYLNPKLPEAEAYRDYRLERPMRVMSEDGALLSEFGTRRLIPIEMLDVPQQYIDAVIATEDKRFYTHGGIDWISLGNDLLDFVKNPDVRRGASTITMQLPRNVADLSREQTVIRKAKEMLLAIKIENELTKDEILELYINVIPFGKHSYGLKAAAYTYYDQPPNELDLAQLAMLAGIPKRPEACNPINGPACALERRNLVLRRMRAEEFISQAEYAQAVATPITANVHRRELDLNSPYPSESIRREIAQRFGNEIYSGYTVESTIIAKHQEAAQIALRSELENYDRRYGFRGALAQLGDDPAGFAPALEEFSNVEELLVGVVTEVNEQDIEVLLKDGKIAQVDWNGLRWARKYLGLDAVGRRPRTADEVVAIGDVVRVGEGEDGAWELVQEPRVTGALVSLNPLTGGVTAMVGGYSFYGKQFNSAEQARRQPGSGIKPFLYSAAIQTGAITPATIFNDAPLVFPDEGLETFYRPRNDGGTFGGPTRLREALYRSVNLVSLRVFMRVGAESVIQHMQRFGFKEEVLPNSTQLAIGGGTLTATPLEMASAYAVLANGGYRVEPHLVSKVYNQFDELVYEARHPVVCKGCEEIADLEIAPPNSELTTAEVEANTGISLDSGELQIGEATEEPVLDADSSLVATRVVDEQNIFLMNSMLRDVVNRGTGRRALQLNRTDLAGKTGTTDEATDTWFNGFHPSLVASVWVGFENQEPLGELEYGSTRPLSIWIEFMREALDDVPNSPLVQPKGIVRVRIDPETGKHVRGNVNRGIWEYFREENSPVAKNRSNRSDSNDDLRPEDIF